MRSHSAQNLERGVAYLLGLITIGGLGLLMFAVIQLAKARVTGLHNLYLTIQAVQSGWRNAPHPQDAMNAAWWSLALNNVTGLPIPVYGGAQSLQNMTVDGLSGKALINYTEVNNAPDTVTVQVEQTETLLQNLMGFLAPIETKARLSATGPRTFFNLGVDLSTIWRRSAGPDGVYQAFGLVPGVDYDDTGGSPTVYDLIGPNADLNRKRLPFYLQGKRLYTPDGAGGYVQNCAKPYEDAGLSDLISAPFKDPKPRPPYYYDSTELTTYSGSYAEQMTETNIPGTPGDVNGWCIHPWDDPALTSYGDPEQKTMIWRRMSSMVHTYQEYVETMLQYLSESEDSLRFSYIVGPTSGGMIEETKPDGSLAGGDIELWNADSGNMYTTSIDLSSILATTVSTSVGGCGATASFDTNIGTNFGAIRMTEWIGRAATDFKFGDFGDLTTHDPPTWAASPMPTVVNWDNSAHGIDYLRPLRNPYQAGFDTIRTKCGSWAFGGDDHPAWAGFSTLPAFSALTGHYFSDSGTVSHSSFATPVEWPAELQVDEVTGERLVDELDNSEDVGHYAPCIFKTLYPIGLGRDYRAAFDNARRNCEARKTTFGASTPCITVVMVLGEPDLTNSGAVPACTTAATLPWTSAAPLGHKELIEEDLVAYEALGETVTILVRIGVDGALSGLGPGDPVYDFIQMFDNAAHPQRFYLNIEAVNTNAILSKGMGVVNSLSLLRRQVAQLQK